MAHSIKSSPFVSTFCCNQILEAVTDLVHVPCRYNPSQYRSDNLWLQVCFSAADSHGTSTSLGAKNIAVLKRCQRKHTTGFRIFSGNEQNFSETNILQPTGLTLEHDCTCVFANACVFAFIRSWKLVIT